MSATPARTLALVALLGSPVAAQSFYYPDFANMAGLDVNGVAAQSGAVLRVTGNFGNATGSCFYDTPVSVAGGFDTRFDFVVDTVGGSGADGMAFVIHNDPRGASALGDTGSALAYGAYNTSAPGTAIANSVVVEFDTWLSAGDLDSSDNEISIHTNGTGDNAHHEDYSLGRVTPTTNMSDGLPHTARILYTGGQLSVFLDDLNNPVLTVPYDFATGGTWANGGTVGGLALIGGADAYVGFSAATGGVSEIHDIVTWEYGGSSLGTRYCVATPNSTGAPAAITAIGSTSVSTADLTLTSEPVPDQPSVFLYGQNQASLAFGNGFRCATGNTGTLPVVYGSGNVAQFIVDFNNLPASAPINPGDTWNFQHWYRDPVAGGAYFNLSDAVSITFTP